MFYGMSDFKFAFAFPDASDDVGGENVEEEEEEEEAVQAETPLKTSDDLSSVISAALEEDYECFPPLPNVFKIPVWRKLHTPGGLCFDVVDTTTSGCTNDIIDGLPEDTDLVSGRFTLMEIQ